MSVAAPTALSLFSGIGGFCEGLRLAGFQIVGAVEHDKYAAESYRANFPDTPLYEGDIEQFLSSDNFESHANQYLGAREVDVLFGGPPCQGYSQIGPRKVSDPRNSLYKEFCRVADVVRPKILLIENVPNMFMMSKGRFRDEIFNELRSVGFGNIGWVKLNGAEYGVPQERKRIFILACRDGLEAGPAQELLDEAAVSLTRDVVSVEEAIGDLPKVVAADSGHTVDYDQKDISTAFQREMRLDQSGSFYSSAEKKAFYHQHSDVVELHNHHTKAIQQKRLALIKLLAPGAKANSLPKHVWNNARPEKWRRFDPNKPAHTLLAQMHRDLSEWIHPHWDRWITVREALRLQSFHDGFVLKTSEWQQLKQVGNAVPPLLGYVPAMAAQLGLAKEAGIERPFKGVGQGNLFL